jgi:predicted GIY-YIG superfamily endonuclease
MVYVEPADNRSSASIREAQIKKLSRKNKLALIDS